MSQQVIMCKVTVMDGGVELNGLSIICLIDTTDFTFVVLSLKILFS